MNKPTLYVKVGRRYVPWGIYDNGIPIHQGLYIVKHRKNHSSMERIELRDEEDLIPEDIIDRYALEEKILEIVLALDKEKSFTWKEVARNIAYKLIPAGKKKKKQIKLKIRNLNG
jgi:hypothetical protein